MQLPQGTVLLTSIRYGAIFLPIIPCTLLPPFYAYSKMPNILRTDSAIGSANSLLFKLSRGPRTLGMSGKMAPLEDLTSCQLMNAQPHAPIRMMPL